MAYVNGPLHSQTASGQVAKSAIYQTYHGRTYAKRYAVPGNTPGHDKMNQTPAQLAVQALTKSLMQHWKEISAEDQATWDALAVPKRIGRSNAYLKYNYARHAVGLDPTDVYPPVAPPTWPKRIYTGGTVTPNPAIWYTEFADGGQITLAGNEVFITADATTIQTNADNALDGQFDLSGLTALEYLTLNQTAITEPPDLSGLTALSYLDISQTAITEPPDVSGLTALEYLILSQTAITEPPDVSGLTALTSLILSQTAITEPPDLTGLTTLTNCDLSNTALAEVDSIFNTIAAICPHDAGGYIDTSGGTSTAPTSASAAARAALTEPNGNWAIITN